MRIRARNTGRTAVAAVTLGALAALIARPAVADHLAPGQVAFVGAYATDGVISGADAALPQTDRVVDWQDPGGGMTGASGRFTKAGGVAIDPACGPFPLGVTGNSTPPGTGYVNDACLAAAPDGAFEWRVAWTDGITTTAESVASITIDRSANVVITYPIAGSLNPVEILNTGDRIVRVGGNADPGAPITLYEGAQVLGTDTADAGGLWEVPAELVSGTHTVHAVGTDGIGNTTTSNTVTFDVDADLPTATVTSPPNLSVFLPGEQVIIEGTAKDTNVQAFGGVLAVEMNIHDPLTPDIRIPDSPPSNPLDALGIVCVGKIVDQINAQCTACPSSGVNQVTWKFDATYLPSGTYTFQVRTFDKAGNTAIQPELLTIVKL